jgi:hypothetical protein
VNHFLDFCSPHCTRKPSPQIAIVMMVAMSERLGIHG